MGYSELLDDLRAQIGDVWPEVVDNGIYQSVEVSRIPFERKAEDELPFAVVDLDLRPSDDWGGANDVEEGAVSIYYVAGDSVSLDTLTSKLEALREALWPDGLTAGQVMEFPAVSWSMATVAPLAYFLNAQRPFIAGAVIARVLMGEYEE